MKKLLFSFLAIPFGLLSANWEAVKKNRLITEEADQFHRSL